MRIGRQVLALLLWSGAWTAYGQANDDGAVALARIAVVPGRLTVAVYAHQAGSGEGRVPCWTFLSEGLWAKGQREVAISIRREPGRADDAFPPGVLLSYYKTVLGLADQGRIVGSGDFSILAPEEQPLVAGTQFRAVMYLDPQGLPGIQPSAPYLTAILLTLDEGRAAKAFGVTRIMTRLGHLHRYFPTPPWTDRRRAPVVTAEAMAGSVLQRIPLGRVAGAMVRREAAANEKDCGRIVLRLRPQAAARVHQIASLGQVPVAILTDPDPEVGAMLVWEPGKRDLTSIVAPGGDDRRLGGSFLALVPQAEEDGGGPVEDGFLVLLREASWKAVMQALDEGRDVAIAPTGQRLGLTISWLPAVLHDP